MSYDEGGGHIKPKNQHIWVLKLACKIIECLGANIILYANLTVGDDEINDTIHTYLIHVL